MKMQYGQIAGTFYTLRFGSAAMVLLLLGAGVIGAAAHQTFDLSLGIPGHQGLVWMALLAFVRGTSPLRWAATITAFGALTASVLPAFGGHGPLTGWHYLLTGIGLDLAFALCGRRLPAVPVIAVGAALAFALKPVSKWLLAAAFDFQFGSIVHGLGYPLFTHLAFGLAGGMVGASAAALVHRAARASG